MPPEGFFRPGAFARRDHAGALLPNSEKSDNVCMCFHALICMAQQPGLALAEKV
jgi:hypothetical protein